VGQAFLEHRIKASDTTGEIPDKAYQTVCSALDAAFRAVV
jgi:hypothetical protein